jgi:hypothetical protein
MQPLARMDYSYKRPSLFLAVASVAKNESFIRLTPERRFRLVVLRRPVVTTFDQLVGRADEDTAEAEAGQAPERKNEILETRAHTFDYTVRETRHPQKYQSTIKLLRRGMPIALSITNHLSEKTHIADSPWYRTRLKIVMMQKTSRDF